MAIAKIFPTAKWLSETAKAVNKGASALEFTTVHAGSGNGPNSLADASDRVAMRQEIVNVPAVTSDLLNGRISVLGEFAAGIAQTIYELGIFAKVGRDGTPFLAWYGASQVADADHFGAISADVQFASISTIEVAGAVAAFNLTVSPKFAESPDPPDATDARKGVSRFGTDAEYDLGTLENVAVDIKGATRMIAAALSASAMITLTASSTFNWNRDHAKALVIAESSGGGGGGGGGVRNVIGGKIGQNGADGTASGDVSVTVGQQQIVAAGGDGGGGGDEATNGHWGKDGVSRSTDGPAGGKGASAPALSNYGGDGGRGMRASTSVGVLTGLTRASSIVAVIGARGLGGAGGDGGISGGDGADGRVPRILIVPLVPSQ